MVTAYNVAQERPRRERGTTPSGFVIVHKSAEILCAELRRKAFPERMCLPG
jgi:histidine ammonia-lyase